MNEWYRLLYLIYGLAIVHGLLDPPTDQISELLEAVNILNKTVGDLKKENENLTKKVVNLENSVKSQSAQTPIAFSVALTSGNKAIGDHQAIEYDHVITNIGNAYDARHGHFTAPVKGIYLFSVTAMSGWGTHNGESLYLQIVKNGAEVGRVYSSPGTDTSSTSVLTSLEVGDMVWVRSFAVPNQVIHGGLYDGFSGTLIFQMS